MMKRRMRPTFTLLPACFALAAALVLLAASPAQADEDDDIQRQIDAQKAGVPDLEHLDTRHAAAADIQRLRDWLNTAWDLRNKHEPDEAREVLDRCLSQSELIRQIIATSQVEGDVAAKEAKLQRTKEEIVRKKRALQEAEAKKKVLDQAASS
jgi:outer membrane usher protein FimD/PapC